MKNKRLSFGIVLFLFVVCGICNVVNVSAEEIEMPPTSYYAQGFDVVYRDELEIYVSSSGVINTYIMTEEQYGVLKDSGGLTWNYLARWKDMTYLEYIYTIPADGIYYVIVYNKDLFSERIVNIEITVDYYYEPYDPYDLSDRYFLERLFWGLLIIFVPVGIVIIIAVVLIKKHKRKDSKKIIIVQEREVLKGVSYCQNCGKQITSGVDYCSGCGAKQ